MENEDNILERIKELLGRTEANFSILEHQIDVSAQIEYFEFSKQHPAIDNPENILNQENKLFAEDVDNSEKRTILVNLASVCKPEAYKILQRFTEQAPHDLKDWAIMATQENRMLLETQLMEESQIFISTGLGGKAGKLRYFIVIFPSANQPFTQLQRNTIASEFEFILKRFHSEIEDIAFNNSYCTFIALVPLSVAVRKPFQVAIAECNSLGFFIQEGFLVTNIKVLSEKEILSILNEPNEGITD